MKNPELRIIGGKFKKRKVTINTTNIELRPTLDRVRETVFNWLAPFLPETNCLDLFAGTGIFSFEALSRGAKCATAIEIDPLSYKNIVNNKYKLKLDDQQLQVFNQDVLYFLKNIDKINIFSNNKNNIINKNFNLVFLDPPYAKLDLLLITLNLLIINNILAKKSKIYFECSKNSYILEQINFPKQLKLSKFSQAGKVNFYLFDYLRD